MRLSASDRLLFVRAWCTVFFMRIALWLLPVRLLAHRPPVRTRTGADPKRLAWAVSASAPYVPASTCLVQALAAQRLFARSGFSTEVRIGVAKPDGQFAAHAWLEFEGTTALGASPVHYSPILIHPARHNS